jgi:large subunit ribosomal protein L9
VFSQDVVGLGEAGDTVKVRHGYARNFLIPERKAVIATHAAISRYAKGGKVHKVSFEKLLEKCFLTGYKCTEGNEARCRA